MGTPISELPAASSVTTSYILPVVALGSPNVTYRATVAQTLASVLPLTGGTLTGGLTISSGSLKLDNNIPIQGVTTGAVTGTLLNLDASNNVDFGNAGGQRIRWLNQAGSTELIGSDNSGNITVETSVAVPTATITTAGITTANITTGNITTVSASTVDTADLTVTSAATIEGNGVQYLSFATNYIGFHWISPNLHLVVDGTDEGAFASQSGVAATYVSQASLAASVTTGAIVVTSYFSSSISGTSFVYSPTGPATAPPTGVNAAVQASQSMIANNYYATSDERTKEDISEITDQAAVDFVLKSRPCTYRKFSAPVGVRQDDEKGTPEAGLIAQDQYRAGYGQYIAMCERKGVPERVYGDGMRISPDTLLNLDRTTPVAYLLAACKHLLARVEELESRL